MHEYQERKSYTKYSSVRVQETNWGHCPDTFKCSSTGKSCLHKRQSYLLLSVDHCPMKSSPSHLYIKCTSCNACQRAVCSRERGKCPKQVKYINKQCETFLQEAQKRVNSQVSSFEDDSGLTQTFNQAAREYVTVLTNGVWMNFVKWQTKLIQCFLIDIIHAHYMYMRIKCTSCLRVALRVIVCSIRHQRSLANYQ